MRPSLLHDLPHNKTRSMRKHDANFERVVWNIKLKQSHFC